MCRIIFLKIENSDKCLTNLSKIENVEKSTVKFYKTMKISENAQTIFEKLINMQNGNDRFSDKLIF